MASKVIIITVLSVFIAYQLVDQFDSETVRGKNVIITGGSSGIGEQLAYHYARLGANIVITARTEQKLQQVIEKCKEIGTENGKYHFVSLDMMDKEAPLQLVKYAESVLGGIDYLVLNHILSYDIGRWVGSKQNFTTLERTFTVNFNAYVSIASHALRHLEASRGSIIVMSSIMGKFPQVFAAPYSASKFALQVSICSGIGTCVHKEAFPKKATFTKGGITHGILFRSRRCFAIGGRGDLEINALSCLFRRCFLMWSLNQI